MVCSALLSFRAQGLGPTVRFERYRCRVQGLGFKVYFGPIDASGFRLRVEDVGSKS